MEILGLILVAGVAYYLYKMLPYWYKQGYNSPKEHEPNTNNLKPEAKPKHNFEDNKAKGDSFENYIVSLFNNEGHFKIVEWRGDKIADNGLYAQTNHLPDLVMSYKDQSGRQHEFAIECKWRKEFFNGQIEWAKTYQIKNYVEFKQKRRIPVFVAIGVGGSPASPEQLFVSEISNVSQYPTLYESFIKTYKRNPNHKFFYSPQQKLLY